MSSNSTSSSTSRILCWLTSFAWSDPAAHHSEAGAPATTRHRGICIPLQCGASDPTRSAPCFVESPRCCSSSPVSSRARRRAQGERLTRIIVAFPAGGPVDFVARAIADPLGKELGTRVIVDNKPGGNGAIAAETVARVGARRHDAVAHERGGRRHQSGAVRQAVLRRAARLRAGVARRQQRRAPGRQRQRSREHRARVHRQREEAPGPDADRLHRHREHPALCGGAARRRRARRTCCTCRTRARRPRSPTSWAGRWRPSSATSRDSSRK